mmetsp:Transcript_147988/g.368822  ORF Transcript_147988/g.368822 Transcript_147988/m.368822 type:complete len:202 (+) Transcript_147988:409-1014(+)
MAAGPDRSSCQACMPGCRASCADQQVPLSTPAQVQPSTPSHQSSLRASTSIPPCRCCPTLPSCQAVRGRGSRRRVLRHRPSPRCAGGRCLVLPEPLPLLPSPAPQPIWMTPLVPGRSRQYLASAAGPPLPRCEPPTPESSATQVFRGCRACTGPPQRNAEHVAGLHPQLCHRHRKSCRNPGRGQSQPRPSPGAHRYHLLQA